MNSQERNIIGALVFLMIVLWGGFIWHSAPSFPGSFGGSMVGIVAALFMFFPFFYMIIKRNKSLKKWVKERVSMSTLLLLHIYAGVVGPILGLLHSAHRFDSLLGILLILLMMIVAISGFIGRYILSLISSKLRDKKAMKVELQDCLAHAKIELYVNRNSEQISAIAQTQRTFLLAIPFPSFWNGRAMTSSESNVLKLIDALSDVEYSINIHDTAKLWFKRWLKFHIAISMLLYVLLIFHISAEIYFGLRWL